MGTLVSIFKSIAICLLNSAVELPLLYYSLFEMGGWSKVQKGLASNAHFLVPLGVVSTWGLIYVGLEAVMPYPGLATLGVIAATVVYVILAEAAGKQRRVSMKQKEESVAQEPSDFEKELLEEEEKEKAKKDEKDKAKLAKKVEKARQDSKMASKAGLTRGDLDDDINGLATFAGGKGVKKAPAAAPAATLSAEAEKPAARSGKKGHNVDNEAAKGSAGGWQSS